jgi:hypothetical protein
MPEKQSKEPAKESVDKIEENPSQRSVKMGPGPVFSSLAMNEEGGEEGGYALLLFYLRVDFQGGVEWTN